MTVNPKSETLNSKQIQITKIQNTKLTAEFVLDLLHLNFKIV